MIKTRSEAFPKVKILLRLIQKHTCFIKFHVVVAVPILGQLVGAIKLKLESILTVVKKITDVPL